MQHDYDMIVIGSGPSGRRAAVQSAKLGKSVLVVEKGRRVGGVSVHTGTIPSKTLRETVLNLSGWRERGFYGRSYRVKQDIDAGDLMVRLRMTLDHEVEVLEHQFDRNAVKHTRGEGRFVEPHEIEVTADNGETQVYRGDNILIACGTRPYRPDYVPFNGKTVFDSDEIIDLPALPRSLTVIGAGVIGVEYATIFSALDVAVTLIEPRPSLLDFVDRELVDEFMHELRDRNLAHAVRRQGDGDRDRRQRPADHQACGRPHRHHRNAAVRRRPRRRHRQPQSRRRAASTSTIADDIKVEPKTMQTSVPHIYRLGRRDRVSESGFDLDGAGACGGLPRLRHAAAAAAGVLSLRHLFGAGDFHRRHERGGGAPARASLTSAASRASARPRAATSWG